MASEIAKAAIARITKNQAISAKILIAMMDGIPVDQAIDRVLGAGTWKKLTSELYDELRKKDRASRPGEPDTFAVDGKVRRAAEMTQEYGFGGVPVVIVGGKYMPSPNLGTFGNMLEVVDGLIAKNRSEIKKK